MGILDVYPRVGAYLSLVGGMVSDQTDPELRIVLACWMADLDPGRHCDWKEDSDDLVGWEADRSHWEKGFASFYA